MSQMIDLETAKTMLGCDDATLQNLIDGGSVRAQRKDGRLMVSLEDIKAQSGEKSSSSDSILVLDSDDQLSIDLGSVDDSSQTMALGGAQTQELESASGTDSLSFGDELEVVSVEERSHHDSLAEGDGVATANIDDAANTQQLNFTDSNTAVMTDVDETVVDTGTATSDYQTVDEQGADGPNAGVASARVPSGRKSVRGSGRGMTPVEERKIPIWVVGIVFVLAVVNLGIILPTWTVALWPREGVYPQTGEKKFGADDGLWSNMASMLAGFSVEPDPDQFKKGHPGEVHIAIDKSSWDGQKGASFRSDEYLGPNYKGKPMAGALRAQSYLISSIETSTKTVDSKEVEIVNRATAIVKAPDGSIFKHVYEVEPDIKDGEGQDTGRYQIKSSKYQTGTKEGSVQ